MAKPPIEMMLDNVEWVPVEVGEEELYDGLPCVTHEGVLKIPNCPDISVYQLSTGLRVVTPEGLGNFMEWLEKG